MKIIGLIIFLLLFPLYANADPATTIIERATTYGNISYPQISGLTDKKIEQSINQAIQDDVSTWTCDIDGKPPLNNQHSGYNAKTTLRLTDNQWLSFTVKKSYYCGGSYPSDYMDSYNFDLKQGALISLERLLLPEMQGKDLTEFLIADHKFVGSCMDENGVSDIAEMYNAEYISDLWDYYREKDQIVFFPRLPHAAQACFEEFPVPLKKIEAYLQP